MTAAPAPTITPSARRRRGMTEQAADAAVDQATAFAGMTACGGLCVVSGLAAMACNGKQQTSWCLLLIFMMPNDAYHPHPR